MRRMLNHKGEEIVYIDYINGIPHQVFTARIGRHGLSGFDFEFVYGYKTDIRFYEAGGGGGRNEIPAPHFIEGAEASYWMASDCKFKGRSKAKHCIRVDRPLQINGGFRRSINPFKVAGETGHGFDYCSECDMYTCDGDGCHEHQEWCAKKESLIYRHNGSLVSKIKWPSDVFGSKV